MSPARLHQLRPRREAVWRHVHATAATHKVCHLVLEAKVRIPEGAVSRTGEIEMEVRTEAAERLSPTR